MEKYRSRSIGDPSKLRYGDDRVLMNTTTVHVKELDCAAEEALLRKELLSISGVQSIQCDVMNRRVVVTHEGVSTQTLDDAIKRVGMTPTRSVSAAPPVASRHGLIMLGLSGLLAFAAEAVAWTVKTETSALVIGMAVASILLGGLPTIRKGLLALRSLTLNINFLMTAAVIGACAIGEWPEAAVVVFLFAVAELIEAYSLDRARKSIQSLMEMAPEVAAVRQPDGSWQEVAAGEVGVGSIIRVRPGERLALDGIVVSGASAVDQAPITGESIPVDKAAGDTVFAGTINGNGLLEFRTTGGRDQTTIARIIRTVQEAQGTRAPTQRFVDSFARVYTPIVCGLAVLVVVLPWLVFQQPLLPWLYKALVLLVIACPCALVISTPVTIVSGLSAAAKQGILVKGGMYLEGGKKLKVVAMDKTGTITEGKPKLTDIVPLGGRAADDVLRIAASLDAISDHPVARAVTDAWDDSKAKSIGALLAVQDFRSITGRGVEGTIDGISYLVGNHRLAEERRVCSPAIEAELAKLEEHGKTAIVVADVGGVLGVLAVADTPRPTSVKALAELHSLGLRTVLLTGDNPKTAAAIAREVGIDDARGNLLPEDKLAAIDDLIRTHEYVGMVGDGVNDAPALAKATIGFAMGAAGTDTALETADVALMQDDLRAIPTFIRLSKRTASILRQNIVIAIGTKGVFFALAMVGAATLWMAVIADVGASLVVLLNGVRLRRASYLSPTLSVQ